MIIEHFYITMIYKTLGNIIWKCILYDMLTFIVIDFDFYCMDNDIAQIDKFESKINKTINNITQIMDNSDLKIKYDQFKDLHEELDTIFKQTKNAILKP